MIKELVIGKSYKINSNDVYENAFVKNGDVVTYTHKSSVGPFFTKPSDDKETYTPPLFLFNKEKVFNSVDEYNEWLYTVLEVVNEE